MRDLFVVTLLFFVVVHCVDLNVGNYNKCCDTDEYLKLINNTLSCSKNYERRLNVLNERDNFLRKNVDGECVEASDNFFIFDVSNGSITRKKAVDENYFPKCCPLNFIYDSTFRTCVEATNRNTWQNYIKTKYVKVGLPNCKIIVDEEINITKENEDYISNNGNNGIFCIDKDVSNKFVIRKCVDDFEICNNIRCIRKCCPDGQSFVNGGICVDTYVHGLNLNFSGTIQNPLDDFAIIYHTKCPKVYLWDENRFISQLLSNGIFKFWDNKTDGFIEDDLNTEKSYCIEHAKKGENEGWHFFYCYEERQLEDKFRYTLWAKILSCICLIVTILVLNEMRNTFGKVLICYCVADLCEMALLTYSQMYLNSRSVDCRLIGYLTIYFILAIFTWLNNLCLVVWRTFSSSTVMNNSNFKKFIFYFVYGWGAPLIITLIVLIFDSTNVLPQTIQPYVGVSKCFFDKRADNYAPVLFLHIPQLLLQIANTSLFVRTITYYLKIKKEIDRMKDSTRIGKRKKIEGGKERLILIVKLSIIMGLVFVFEVVSSFFVMSEISDFAKYVEVIMDNITCLQGLLIFLIFVCKRKVYENFRRKFDSNSELSSKPRVTQSESKLL